MELRITSRMLILPMASSSTSRGGYGLGSVVSAGA